MYPIVALQIAQDKFLADFHKNRPEDFNEVRQSCKRISDVYNRVVELCTSYEKYFRDTREMGINITLRNTVAPGGTPPKVPSITTAEETQGFWYPLEGLGAYAKQVDHEILCRRSKMSKKKTKTGVEELNRRIALQAILAPAADIELDWTDWHLFAYGLRCCFGHSDGKQTLGLDPKFCNAALPAARRLKIQTFLVALSNEAVGVDKGRKFARSMLALYDAACHRDECLGYIDENTDCRFKVNGVCTYDQNLTPELFDAVHLWYPRLLRRCAYEHNRVTMQQFPELFTDYKPRRILAAHRAVDGFEGYSKPKPPKGFVASPHDHNNWFILLLISCAVLFCCMHLIYETRILR